jgi:hypothetical protein
MPLFARPPTEQYLGLAPALLDALHDTPYELHRKG